MKRALKWIWRHFWWAILFAPLWLMLGFDRATQVVGTLIVVGFALELYGRFQSLEKQVSELKRKDSQ